MRAFAWLASALVEIVTTSRRARCPHRMVEMVDGPVCGDCGRAWTWAALT